jgi:hypothetical protein
MSGRPVHRMGDINSGKGHIHSIPQGSVFANNLLVAVDGSRGTSHAPCPLPAIHCANAWVTTQGRKTVFAQNISINCESDSDSCGHVRIMGSPNVFAGDVNRDMAIIDST